jgi:hypothetical protein
MGESIQVARWHSDEGCRVVLFERRRSRLRILILDHPVTLRVLPAAEQRYLEPLAYSSKRALRMARAFAAHGNATKPARRFLRGAVA